MKIINYKKTKLNIYEITLDDKSKYSLYDEIILKYNLLLKKEIDLNTLNKMLDDNKYYELYNKCLKYLSTKMRSEKEIYKKFKDYPKKDISSVIQRLKEENYLNNDAYTTAYINDAVNLKMIGYYKIKNDLINLGLKEDEIMNKLDEIPRDVWYEKIKKLSDSMIKNNRKDSLVMLKQRIITSLINKGFSKEDIVSYLDSVDIKIDDSIYDREYNKLKIKLIRKYSGEELEREIKRRLKAKGF